MNAANGGTGNDECNDAWVLGLHQHVGQLSASMIVLLAHSKCKPPAPKGLVSAASIKQVKNRPRDGMTSTGPSVRPAKMPRPPEAKLANDAFALLRN